MKRKAMSLVIAPAAVFLFTAFSVSAALGSEDEQMKKTRQTAEEYWAEFKQDSEQAWDTTREAFRDGWLEGKLETALVLNEHLNPFDIDIRVDGATAVLEGEVSSDIDRELAENVALGIDGIDRVDNRLRVNPEFEHEEESGRDFAQYIADISTTAAIKTELLASDNISGLSVDVDTYRDVVTLKGTVKTEAEKDLAEAIVAKREDIDRIINQLRVEE